MRFPRLTGLAIASLIVLAALLGACTRSAATPAPGTPQAQTTAGMTGQQATMEAVRSALLTQTAQAAAGSGAATSTPLVVVTQGTPSAPLTTPGSGTPAATAGSAGATPTCGPTTYTVLSGEWVYSIARKFNVDPQAIIDLNGLVAPYALTPGQTLKIPGSCPSAATPVVVATVTPGGPTVTPGGTVTAGTVYIVQAGEWVYSIARKFGVDPQAIIDANNLVAPYTLSVGQKLTIPAP
jgi:LysM repeat protein